MSQMSRQQEIDDRVAALRDEMASYGIVAFKDVQDEAAAVLERCERRMKLLEDAATPLKDACGEVEMRQASIAAASNVVSMSMTEVEREGQRMARLREESLARIRQAEMDISLAALGEQRLRAEHHALLDVNRAVGEAAIASPLAQPQTAALPQGQQSFVPPPTYVGAGALGSPMVSPRRLPFDAVLPPPGTELPAGLAHPRSIVVVPPPPAPSPPHVQYIEMPVPVPVPVPTVIPQPQPTAVPAAAQPQYVTNMNHIYSPQRVVIAAAGVEGGAGQGGAAQAGAAGSVVGDAASNADAATDAGGEKKKEESKEESSAMTKEMERAVQARIDSLLTQVRLKRTIAQNEQPYVARRPSPKRERADSTSVVTAAAPPSVHATPMRSTAAPLPPPAHTPAGQSITLVSVAPTTVSSQPSVQRARRPAQDPDAPAAAALQASTGARRWHPGGTPMAASPAPPQSPPHGMNTGAAMTPHPSPAYFNPPDAQEDASEHPQPSLALASDHALRSGSTGTDPVAELRSGTADSTPPPEPEPAASVPAATPQVASTPFGALRAMAGGVLDSLPSVGRVAGAAGAPHSGGATNPPTQPVDGAAAGGATPKSVDPAPTPMPSAGVPALQGGGVRRQASGSGAVGGESPPQGASAPPSWTKPTGKIPGTPSSVAASAVSREPRASGDGGVRQGHSVMFADGEGGVRSLKAEGAPSPTSSGGGDRPEGILRRGSALSDRYRASLTERDRADSNSTSPARLSPKITPHATPRGEPASEREEPLDVRRGVSAMVARAGSTGVAAAAEEMKRGMSMFVRPAGAGVGVSARPATFGMPPPAAAAARMDDDDRVLMRAQSVPSRAWNKRVFERVADDVPVGSTQPNAADDGEPLTRRQPSFLAPRTSDGGGGDNSVLNASTGAVSMSPSGNAPQDPPAGDPGNQSMVSIQQDAVFESLHARGDIGVGAFPFESYASLMQESQDMHN